MDIRPIKSDADHRAALGEIEALWGAEEGTPEGGRLDVLATLVAGYEERRWPTEETDGAATFGNRHRGSTLDSFLEEDGVLPAFQAKAIKEVIAWQLAEAMRERGLSRNGLATLMKTSRTQVARVLDPAEGNVTIETLQRAAAIVGRTVRLELV